MLDKDKTLVKNTLNGDIDSFSQLIGSYQESLFNFLFRLTSCREDAEEVLQDVFIRVYNYLYKYDERWNFSTWIYKIAVNSFKDHYKKRRSTSTTLHLMSCLNAYSIQMIHLKIFSKQKLMVHMQACENCRSYYTSLSLTKKYVEEKIKLGKDFRSSTIQSIDIDR